MQNGDIVRFRLFGENGEENSCDAVRFCIDHSITGVVVDALSAAHQIIINVGFEYTVFARPEEVDIVVPYREIPSNEDPEG